jgi:hypothetical protein
MKSLLTWKSFRFVLVTVVLGAVGSGVWEWILKPVLSGSSEVALTVATLGITAFKNSLYQDIALGFREEPSLRLYTAAFAFLPSMIIGFVSGIVVAHRRATSGQPESMFERVIDRSVRPVLLLVIFALVFSVVQASQVAYVNRAVTHFQQLSAIAAPHLSENQRLAVRSRFAQIATRDDYVKLVEELSGLCRSKSLRVPQFEVW